MPLDKRNKLSKGLSAKATSCHIPCSWSLLIFPNVLLKSLLLGQIWTAVQENTVKVLCDPKHMTERQYRLLGKGKTLLVSTLLCLCFWVEFNLGHAAYCRSAKRLSPHVYHLKFSMLIFYYCLQADDSWRPAPGKCALASIWISIQWFQPGRRWEQAQLLSLSRAYLEMIQAPGEALKHFFVCDPQPAAGNYMATFPQQLRSALCVEGRVPKSQGWHWSQREFAAQLDWSCSNLCCWHTISLREHIILLDLPNICQFCAIEEFLYPAQNS